MMRGSMDGGDGMMVVIRRGWWMGWFESVNTNLASVSAEGFEKTPIFNRHVQSIIEITAFIS